MKSKGKPGGSSAGPRDGKAPDWAMRMKFFSPGQIPTRIRLIPQNPEQLWFSYYSKWHKSNDPQTGKQVNRNVIGNSHNGAREVPDLLYYYAIKQQNADLMASEQFAVTVVVLEDFHEVEKGKSKAGNPYYDYVRCTGKNRFGQSVCELCNQGVKKTFGQRLHWSLWPSAKRGFEEQLHELNNRCVGCNKGELSVYGYNCASCGSQFANHYDKTIDPMDEKIFQTEEVTCQDCGKTGMAGQLIECVVRHGSGDDVSFSEGCKNPTRPEPVESPWDYDLTVVSEAVGKSSRVVVTGFTPKKQYPQLSKDLEQPFNFIFFDRMTMEDQAKAMNRAVPPEWGDVASVQRLVDQFFNDKAQEQFVSPDKEDGDSVPWSR